MKREFRLTRPADFKRVRHDGRSYAHPLVVLIARPNGKNRNRVGVSAGRSVGGAVQRNRAKRLLRHAMAPLMGKITPGYDILLLARKPILEVKSDQVRQALIEKLQKARLLPDDRTH